MMAKEATPKVVSRESKRTRGKRLPTKAKKSHDENKSKGEMNKIKCFNCNQLGHMIKDCPKSIKVMQDL